MIKCEQCKKGKMEKRVSSHTHYTCSDCNCLVRESTILEATKPRQSKPIPVPAAIAAGSKLPTCKLCDSRLQQRSSRYGIFFGCSRFPGCKFTMSLSNYRLEAEDQYDDNDVQTDHVVHLLKGLADKELH